MELKNTTTYDADLINDASKALAKSYKAVIGVAASILVLMEIYMVLTYGAALSAVTIIPLVGIALILPLGFVKINTYKKALMKRIQVVSHDDKVSFDYVIDEEKIVMTSANGTNTLYHKDIKKVSETKKQYVVIYNGSIFALISKDGFEGEDKLHGLLNF
ncbi:MAG: YcxB family protein [Lachnospiraceae bacterium]|nr:YcxB family protein [Lachnospiraceae bacterium]